MNDSSTGGFIVPTPGGPPPLDDAALDRVLQVTVVGTTGLAGSMVRPRWQPSPPQMPEASVDWCAIGVTMIEPEGISPAVVHHPSSQENPDGYDELRQYDRLTVMASFYGPHAMGNARLFRDGIRAEGQNREAWLFAGLGLMEAGRGPRQANELLNNVWYRRMDVDFRVRQITRRFYPVRNIVRAAGTIWTDNGASGPFDDSFNDSFNDSFDEFGAAPVATSWDTANAAPRPGRDSLNLQLAGNSQYLPLLAR